MEKEMMLFDEKIYDHYEKTKIPLAVFYVEEGRFRAYIVSDGACRMYHSTREEMMARLNGPDPFVNIIEKEEMTDAVRAFSDKDEPYDVVFHEFVGSQRKLITVHGYGFHEYTANGKKYSILLYDEVSDRARRNLFKDEKTLLIGLSCEYETVWLVDASIHHGKLILNNMGDTRSSVIMTSMNEGNYEALLENYIEKYVVPADRERMYAETDLSSLLRNARKDELYYVNYSRINEEGETNYMQLAYARVTDDAGIDQFVCGFRNIDAVIATEKEKNALYRMAHVDSMTGIGNRRAFDEYMDSYIGKKPESDLALFYFDLNELKSANDTYGHEAGDELITGAADCMKKAFGGEGSVYRIGGDEFAAFIRCDAARYIKIEENLGELFKSWKGKYSHGISIATGHVRSDEAPEKSIQELSREAEDRMYKQKKDYYTASGKDRRKSS